MDKDANHGREPSENKGYEPDKNIPTITSL